MSNTGMAIVLASIFLIMLTFTIHALEQSPELRKMKIVLSLPVSALCVLSFLRGAGDVRETRLIDIVLVPYEALTYTVILIIILWLLSRVFLRIRNVSEDCYDRTEIEYFGQRHMTAIKRKKLENAKLQEESTEV